MHNSLKNKYMQDGLAVLALGLALGAFSLYSFFTSSVKSAWIMSPYLFPMLVSIFAILLGLSLMYEARRQRLGKGASADDSSADTPVRLKNVLAVIAMGIAYYVLMSLITFIPATMLFLAAMMWFMGERRVKLLVPLVVLVPLVLYALFAMGLNVRLP